MRPEDTACTVRKRGPLTLSIVRADMGHWCGYVRFPVCPMITEKGYKGILTYVPVHGGITFAARDGRQMIYGFDCGHLEDNTRPKCQDPEWLMEEAWRMAKAIMVATLFDLPYMLTTNWQWGRLHVVVAYTWVLHKMGMDLIITDNFGVMINLLCGKL